MFRRSFLTAGLVVSLLAAPAFAADRVEQLVRDLQGAGFTQIELSRTWLGRTRIVATGRAGIREIVVNPTTGEVLRDIFSDDGRESDRTNHIGGDGSVDDGDSDDGDSDSDGGDSDGGDGDD